MSNPESRPKDIKTELTEHVIRVLLIDDQAMIGEAVRRMLAAEKDIEFHYCGDPTKAIKLARELSPTVILQDLVMPEIDGLTLVKFFRANSYLKDIPLIVLSTKEEPKIKAEAFALGANDYLVKLPDKIELIARIRYHSKGYINLLQRNEAYEALVKSQDELAAELAQAANYVKSLLPEPLEGEIKTEWEFITSTSLGGDSFGYHWLDDEHFAMYLLDVCGHGVGSALMSISAMNVLRSRTLGATDWKDPAEVLSVLNNNFQMEDHNGLYFTMWYGVYNKTNRTLKYASGGHPPAILVNGSSPESLEVHELKTPGMIIGGMPDMPYENAEITLDNCNELFIYSDGVYEVFTPDNVMFEFPDFVKILTRPSDPGVSDIQRILDYVRDFQKNDDLEDDFSMVKIIFN